MTRHLSPALACALLLASGLAAAAEPTAEELRARNPTLEVRWVATDLRPPPFSAVMLAPVALQFRESAPMTGPEGFSGNRTEFPVNERDREDIAMTFARIFREELAESRHVRLTDEAGPGVLVIKPALRDIVSRVPPTEPPGRSYVYLDEVGEASLVLEFVDGASGQTLGTAIDRKKARRSGPAGDFSAIRANKVDAGQEVRRVARRWGTSLRNRVEQLYFAAKPK